VKTQTVDFELPYQYEPRSYQRDLFKAYRDGIKRFITVWHRRAGKDKTWVNFMILRACEEVGVYLYVLDTFTHAKGIVWTNIADGEPFLFKHIPPELIRSKNEQELSVTLVNGSIIRLFGSNQLVNIRGLNPIGIVFSEYSRLDASAWPTFSPILAQNGGWAAFNFTPWGQNHAYNLLEIAKTDPKWFVSIKTRDETFRDAPGEDGSKVVSDEAYTEEQKLHDKDFLEQEYYCAFTGAVTGSYYSLGMSNMQQEGRLRDLPWHADTPVFTVWDLGIADATAIIWAQWVEGYLHIIDYEEFTGLGLNSIAGQVLSRYAGAYSSHYAPHDIGQREYTTGKTRLSEAEKFGIRFKVVPKIGKLDGIDKVRAMLPIVKINTQKCKRLIEALRFYHKKPLDRLDPAKGYDESNDEHDWSSHGADAARYLALVYQDEKTWRQTSDNATTYSCDDDPFETPGTNSYLDNEEDIW
jgi:phage terminase large subunit